MRVVRSSRLERWRADYESVELSYAEVGATRGRMPHGYHHTHFRREIGKGEESFRRAANLLMTWRMQRGAGMGVAAEGPATEGQTVALGVGVPFALLIPCRVVYVVDEPRRRGFGYGTLPGHPERGEEAFVVTMDDADKVWLEITAFSRPGLLVTVVLGYLNPVIQHVALRAYARSMRRQLR